MWPWMSQCIDNKNIVWVFLQRRDNPRSWTFRKKKMTSPRIEKRNYLLENLNVGRNVVRMKRMRTRTRKKKIMIGPSQS